jgi:phage terminase small subunit
MNESAPKRDLKPRQRIFCQQYIIDYNGSKAYRKAYGEHLKDTVCRTNASRLLASESIQRYIKDLTNDLEKAAGISKIGVLMEHKRIAFSSMASLHDTWIDRKTFEDLTEEEKAVIASIETQTRTEFKDGAPVKVEFVKIKLYDKQKSLDSISRLMGYDRLELERLDDESLNNLAETLMKKRNEITQRNN